MINKAINYVSAETDLGLDVSKALVLSTYTMLITAAEAVTAQNKTKKDTVAGTHYVVWSLLAKKLNVTEEHMAKAVLLAVEQVATILEAKHDFR